VSEKSEEKSSSAASSAQSSSMAVFKNVKSMTSQTVVEGDMNPFQKGMQFLREVEAELRKVAWPNRKQTAGSTLVVIILVFIVAAFLGLVDITLSKLVQVVLA
jgi:preprotein translocase subunit SecE